MVRPRLVRVPPSAIEVRLATEFGRLMNISAAGALVRTSAVLPTHVSGVECRFSGRMRRRVTTPVREHEETAVRRSWGVDNTRTALGQNGQGGVRRAGPGRDQGAVRQRTRPRQGSSAPNVGRPAPEGVEDRTLVTRAWRPRSGAPRTP